MNANDAIDSSNQIYVSHCWESMRFVHTLEAGRCYRSYVKMSPVSGGSKMVSGDVYLVEEQDIIGVFKVYLEQFEPRTPSLSEIYTDKGSDEDPTQVNTPAESDDETGVLVMKDDMNPNDHAESIRSTIAEELGVDIKEIGDTVDLSQMELDSLMSLAILGALREKTGLTFASDFLVQHTTIKGILSALGLQHKNKPSSLSSYPQAPIILLSGNPKTARRKLFLLPDGSGAAFSYAPIPELDAETAVFGLNCPFMRNPGQFTIGVPAVTQIYMQATYEMTRQLVAQGDKVDRLVLIDSPYPIGLEALPAVFHEFCNRIGFLGDGQTKTPDWLLPHFRATVRGLTAYSDYLAQTEIDTSCMPSTIIIWGRDGVVKNRGDPEPNWKKGVRMPNSMEWLRNNRHDPGDNGWEMLVGKGKVRCVSMDGNHITMMRESRAGEEV
ncbi:polyketide synthase [Penicillium cf. viridicatum]|uniref:Polyketide synthase n=1 Tax=Penicillium cf. viridicatum TaxID=2972119 RepID=A0A9W9IPW3_9EURO|nr:polyketide synthase [Penicillium cf. viridicatum]